jgi:Fe-Mn family superoxide dismutase
MESQTATSNEQNSQTYPFSLPPLGYDFGALAPFIDAETMEIHHDKHHQAYVDNLNKALAEHVDLHGKTLAELLAQIDSLPDAVKTAVRNNGGGHANHSMFWTIMRKNENGAPSGSLAEAIERDFGSFDDFKRNSTNRALNSSVPAGFFSSRTATSSKSNQCRIRTRRSCRASSRSWATTFGNTLII